MTVLVQNNFGWFLCHKTFINSIYERCINSESFIKLKLKDDFFDINTPILMNSATLKYAYGSQQTQIKKKQKKKKQVIPAKCEVFHNKVEPQISDAVKALIEEARSMGFLKSNEIQPEEWLQNNQLAREAGKRILEKSTILESQCFMVHKNSSTFPVIREGYVIPPYSSYILSDIKNISNLIGNKYDAIVIDPPWENKSVRRKRGYPTLKCEDLLEIPVIQLTKPGSIIAMWATNNEKQIGFIKEVLFPKWGLHCYADWHWVKITTKGSLIHPMDSLQKKPYENLIIGHVCLGNKAADAVAELSKCPEPHKVIVSVPSSIHSHKPPLSEILRPYLPRNAECLEIFARYLIPGWTSFGNEVLKFQTMEMFETVEC